MRSPFTQLKNRTGAGIERPETLKRSFIMRNNIFLFAGMAYTGERVKAHCFTQRKQIMKIEVKIPGAQLHDLFMFYMFTGKEAVHFNTTDQAFVKMIKGAYINSVQLRVHIAYGGQVYAGRMLCPGKQGREQQAGY